MKETMQFKARIKNLAARNNIPAQAVLQNFMLERLLERISLSAYKEMVILKGGMLIASMVGIDSRTTMDMDATLRGYPVTEESLRKALSDICAIQIEDGVIFNYDRIVPIRADDEYGGYRIGLIARYASIKTPLKVDITTGDIITPAAIRYNFHSNFENKNIEVWAYNIETILAEKIETILRRSVLNTRPRDFYDVFIIMKTQKHLIDNNTLLNAIQATSEKRNSLPAINNPNEILISIKSDPTMRERWDRYCKENFYAKGIGFDDVITALMEIANNTILSEE